jgi:hypothetical protein
MTISLHELQKLPRIETLVIHSLDLMLYQVSVELEGVEHYVTDNQGKLLRSHNLLSIQALFEGWPIDSMRLRQQSAYDEMIGQPIRDSNQLEVPLGNNRLGSAASLQGFSLPVRH